MQSVVKTNLQTALENNSHFLSTDIQDRFIAYLLLLEKWNRAFNLTSIRDPNEMITLHILDSLSINPFLKGPRIIDVGTGAGLPGIPLALVNPDQEFVLLDSNSKKTHFLTHAIHELKLKNVAVIHARCEDFKPEPGFDTILSRAFASIKVMLATTTHLLNAQGQFLAMKGVNPAEEIADLSPDFEVVANHPLTIKGLDAQRCVIVIRSKNG